VRGTPRAEALKAWGVKLLAIVSTTQAEESTAPSVRRKLELPNAANVGSADQVKRCSRANLRTQDKAAESRSGHQEPGPGSA
jgi:hypothetical protein